MVVQRVVPTNTFLTARIFNLKTVSFRQPAYGERQFGVEDQGWLAWFIITTILGKEISIFGDGKQVRDILYVKDLVELYDKFIEQKSNLYGKRSTLEGINYYSFVTEFIEI